MDDELVGDNGYIKTKEGSGDRSIRFLLLGLAPGPRPLHGFTRSLLMRDVDEAAILNCVGFPTGCNFFDSDAREWYTGFYERD